MPNSLINNEEKNINFNNLNENLDNKFQQSAINNEISSVN
jgi:hypothetical protein